MPDTQILSAIHGAHQAPGGREERDQAGLQRVVDVGLAGEELVDGLQVVAQFAEPAAVGGVDEVLAEKSQTLRYQCS